MRSTSSCWILVNDSELLICFIYHCKNISWETSCRYILVLNAFRCRQPYAKHASPFGILFEMIWGSSLPKDFTLSFCSSHGWLFCLKTSACKAGTKGFWFDLDLKICIHTVEISVKDEKPFGVYVWFVNSCFCGSADLWSQKVNSYRYTLWQKSA